MGHLPPGYRFHPTDEELVAYYLKRKVGGRSIERNLITEIDLYKQEPWDLPEKSFLPGSDMEWYFFSPRDKKYPNGLRTNRATEAGYWKATGKDRNVKKAGRVVGMKKTLVFYRGRAPHGERTDWVMHEYRLDEEECEKVHVSQDLFVLCRVFKKSGVGPRSGDDRGPQTYVDDDFDLMPEMPVDNSASGLSSETAKEVPVSIDDQEVKGVPEIQDNGPVKDALALEPVPTSSVSTVIPVSEDCPVLEQRLSVDDYTGGREEVGDFINTPISLGDYILNEPTAPQETEEFWDCFSALTGDLDLSSVSEALADGSAERYSAGDLFGTWLVDREPEGLSGMAWNRFLSSTPLQQPDERGGVGGFDMPMELLDADDMLPPLVEERESKNPRNTTEATHNVPNLGENVNQQASIRDPARARSRAARLHQAPEETQRRTHGTSDIVYRNEYTPQQRMSNTNFRGNVGPEVPSYLREDNGCQTMTWAAPSDPASAQPNRPSSCEMGLVSPATNGLFSDHFPASVTDFGNSDPTPSDDNLFSSFQDACFDFAVDDDLIHTSVFDNNFNSAPADDVAADPYGRPEVTRPGDKSEKHSHSSPSEGPPRSSFSTHGGASEATSSSKPLGGLMKLLGSLPALPAAAAECPPDAKPVQQIGEVSTKYSSFLLSAVTVTCTSSADGAQELQAAVTDCRVQGGAQGVYQQVVSGSWQSIPKVPQQGIDNQKPLCLNCDTTMVVGGGLHRKVVRGYNSGFVFVFVLGAVSALCWFLLIRGLWRLAGHVFTSVF